MIIWIVRYNGIEMRFGSNEEQARAFASDLEFCGVKPIVGWIID